MDRVRMQETFRRWIIFSLVGMVGMVIQLLVLSWLLAEGLHYLTATVLAVEAAVLNNFLWHERWTWRERTQLRSRTLSRLLRFNLTVGVLSIAQNVVLMKILVGFLAIHVLAGNLISITICGFANFLLSDRLVFPMSQRACARH